MFNFNPGSQSAGRSGAANHAPIRSVEQTMQHSMGTLLGVAIGLAILSVIAGLSILASGTSSGLTSAITEVNSFLVLIGLGVAVGLVLEALRFRQGR